MYDVRHAPGFHRYPDRRHAGRSLAAALLAGGIRADAVVGLARGGVQVAYEVAARLGVPMDILVVKKLHAPGSLDLAIGAVCADGAQVLLSESIAGLSVPPEYVADEAQARLIDAEAAELVYRSGKPPLDIEGRSVVLADDGVATGATMEVGILSCRRRGARSVVAASPVCAEAAAERLARAADGTCFLLVVPEFRAVGQFYQDFSSPPSEEVQRLLRKGRGMRLRA